MPSPPPSDPSNPPAHPDPAWRERCARWLEHAAREDVRRALDAVYAHAAAAIRERGPACWASGRCCHFETAGHLLYVTGLEAAYTLVSLGRSPQELARFNPALRALRDAPSPRHRPGCVFQDRNLCGVHLLKPLGCRVYFCDRSAQAWQNDLSEECHGLIRGLHTAFAIEYHYAEWREVLSGVLRASHLVAE